MQYVITIVTFDLYMYHDKRFRNKASYYSELTSLGKLRVKLSLTNMFRTLSEKAEYYQNRFILYSVFPNNCRMIVGINHNIGCNCPVRCGCPVYFLHW
jgi:hypothetical protein